MNAQFTFSLLQENRLWAFLVRMFSRLHALLFPGSTPEGKERRKLKGLHKDFGILGPEGFCYNRSYWATDGFITKSVVFWFDDPAMLDGMSFVSKFGPNTSEHEDVSQYMYYGFAFGTDQDRLELIRLGKRFPNAMLNEGLDDQGMVTEDTRSTWIQLFP